MLSYITLTTRLKELSRYYHFHFRYKEIEAKSLFICLFTYSLISPFLSCLVYVIEQCVSRLRLRGKVRGKGRETKKAEKSRKKKDKNAHLLRKNGYPKAIHLISLSSSYLNMLIYIFIFYPSRLQSSVQPYKRPLSALSRLRDMVNRRWASFSLPLMCLLKFQSLESQILYF